MAISQTKNNQSNIGFTLLMLYLFFEYGRPQGLIPALGYLRPGIVLIGALGFCLFISGKIKFESVQSKCMLGFLLLSAIHVPIAVNNYWAFQGAKAFLIYLIVFLSISNYVNSFEKLTKYIDFWIVINFICAFVGLKHGGKVPNSGFMGDENDFALVMNMAIPFAYFMFLETDSIKKKIFYLTACGLFIGANVASFSRGGFVGLLPVAAYCWYKTPRKALATVLMGLMLIIFLAFTTESYWAEMKTIKEENIKTGTGEGRWYAWKLSWKMFLDHPIMGVGQGNWPWNVGRYQPEEDLRYRRSQSGRAVHSLYFTLIPELGLVGILLFSGMLYFSYKDLKWILKKEKEFLLKQNQSKEIIQQLHKIKFIIFGITGAMLGYLVSGAFLSVLYYPYFWLLIALYSALENIAQMIIPNENFPI